MALAIKNTTTTVRAAIPDAQSIAEELRDEMQESISNLPESLQLSSRAEALQEAIDTIDEWCEDMFDHENLPDEILDREVIYGTATRKNQTRRERLNEAIRMLDSASFTISQFVEAIQDKSEEEGEPEYSEEELQEYTDIAEKITEAVHAYEAIHFPGRTG